MAFIKLIDRGDCGGVSQGEYLWGKDQNPQFIPLEVVLTLLLSSHRRVVDGPEGPCCLGDCPDRPCPVLESSGECLHMSSPSQDMPFPHTRCFLHVPSVILPETHGTWRPALGLTPLGWGYGNSEDPSKRLVDIGSMKSLQRMVLKILCF
jgi:hypothetical protein